MGEFRVPRCFISSNFVCKSYELHAFCDASEDAIGFVLYLRGIDSQNRSEVAFVSGNSRVAPRSATSIPRLELCAALEAAKAISSFREALGKKINKIFMYSDSQIVLGYLRNREKRFERYIERRVALILDQTEVANWKYVPSNMNPADIATKPHNVKELEKTCWIEGPAFLKRADRTVEWICAEPTALPGRKFNTLRTEVRQSPNLFEEVAERKAWPVLIGVVRVILTLLSILDSAKQRKGVTLASRNRNPTADHVGNFWCISPRVVSNLRETLFY